MEYIIYNSETRQFSKPKTAEEYDAKIAKLQGKVQDAREGMKISRGEYAKKYAKRGAAIGAGAGAAIGAVATNQWGTAIATGARTLARATGGAVQSGVDKAPDAVHNALFRPKEVTPVPATFSFRPRVQDHLARHQHDALESGAQTSANTWRAANEVGPKTEAPVDTNPHNMTTFGGSLTGAGIGAAVGAGTGAILGYTKHRRLGRSIDRNMRKIAKLEREKQKLNK